MAKSRTLTQIKQNPYQRRLALSLAGLAGGSRIALSGVGNLLKSGAARRRANDATLAAEARRFADALGELKGAYVKIGQLLALYGEHLLPRPIVAALRTLNDSTVPLAWSSIEPVVRAELGPRRDEFEIDPRPLSAASLAQVHRAVHKPSGRAVCLKVQYPGVAVAVDRDFDDVITLLRVARWLQGDSDTKSMLEELRDLLRLEVDYLHEASAADSVASLLAGDRRYRVPAMLGAYCTERLLVMEHVQGVKLDSAEVAALSAARRNRLAAAMLELLFKELFDWRLLQTDANLGNYLVEIGRTRDTLALLDFGAVRALDPGLADAVRETTAAAVTGDAAAVVAGLQAMGCLHEDQPQSARDSFVAFCAVLTEPIVPRAVFAPPGALTASGAYRWRHAQLARRIGKVGLGALGGEGFRLPGRQFALLVRKLAGVYNALLLLDAELDSRALFERYVARRPGPAPGGEAARQVRRAAADAV